MIPQIIYLILTAVSLLLNANKHGQEKTGKYNFWISLFAHTAGVYLLYLGGFFDVILKGF